MAEFPKSWFSSPDSESDTKSWTFTRPIPIPETIKSWGLSLRPRRVPNRETRCVKSESPFYSTKSWSKNVQILWFLPSPSKFRFQIRFRVYNDLKIESDSETVMSPEPRVSVFWFLDERLRKFWSMGSLKVAWYAEIHPLNAGASAGKPEGPRNAI